MITDRIRNLLSIDIPPELGGVNIEMDLELFRLNIQNIF